MCPHIKLMTKNHHQEASYFRSLDSVHLVVDPTFFDYQSMWFLSHNLAQELYKFNAQNKVHISILRKALVLMDVFVTLKRVWLLRNSCWWSNPSYFLIPTPHAMWTNTWKDSIWSLQKNAYMDIECGLITKYNQTL